MSSNWYPAASSVRAKNLPLSLPFSNWSKCGSQRDPLQLEASESATRSRNVCLYNNPTTVKGNRERRVRLRGRIKRIITPRHRRRLRPFFFQRRQLPVCWIAMQGDGRRQFPSYASLSRSTDAQHRLSPPESLQIRPVASIQPPSILCLLAFLWRLAVAFCGRRWFWWSWSIVRCIRLQQVVA